jgi:hypothetical protein
MQTDKNRENPTEIHYFSINNQSVELLSHKIIRDIGVAASVMDYKIIVI